MSAMHFFELPRQLTHERGSGGCAVAEDSKARIRADDNDGMIMGLLLYAVYDCRLVIGIGLVGFLLRAYRV